MVEPSLSLALTRDTDVTRRQGGPRASDSVQRRGEQERD